MDATKDMQDALGSSVRDDTAPSPPEVGQQMQLKTSSQQQGQAFALPRPETPHDYQLTIIDSPPTDYEVLGQVRPSDPFDYERRHSQPVPPSQYQTPLQQYKKYVKFRIDYVSKKPSRQRL